MNCPCKHKPEHADRASSETKPDRYVSFIGLDCDAKADRLVKRIFSQIETHDVPPFWTYFKKKAAGELGPRPDALLLIHSHLNDIRELFELLDDAEGVSLLERIEQECC
ncbi:MAG: hypothetical protein H6R04_681 [Burkholderiaceae bacterium]|nr:hypothetical protein [Burkholderiaceae bacterium]